MRVISASTSISFLCGRAVRCEALRRAVSIWRSSAGIGRPRYLAISAFSEADNARYRSAGTASATANSRTATPKRNRRNPQPAPDGHNSGGSKLSGRAIKGTPTPAPLHTATPGRR